MKKPLKKYVDMTEGNIVRLILAFALPMLIGNVFQQIYSMADTMVAGYSMGDNAIAAIGATSSLFSLIIDFAWGMNSGFALVVTLSFGAHDTKKLRRAIAGTFLLNAIVAVALTLFALLFLSPLMRLMNTPDSIFDQAYRYMLILCAGMVSTIAYNMFAAILRAVGNSRTTLFFLIVANVTNILMDVLLVIGLGLGVAGAALATVIAQTISAVLSGAYLFKNYREILPAKEDYKISRTLGHELVANGIAMAFMLCVVDLGSVIFQGANNRLGDTIIASHTAARRLIVIFMAPISTLASASTTFVGQNFGAKKYRRIQSELLTVIGMEVLWGVFSFVLILFGGGWLVRFTTGTDSSKIIGNAVMSMRMHFLCFPALGILVVLRTALQAMGRKAVTVVSSSMELGMKILAALWLIPTYGFFGTSITEPVTWILCAAFLSIVYFFTRKKLFTESA